jgi:hypothetical protein
MCIPIENLAPVQIHTQGSGTVELDAPRDRVEVLASDNEEK